MSQLENNESLSYDTFAASVQRSQALEEDIRKNPQKHRVLTGDRPTGDLHIGHLFGSLLNRVKLAKLGVETFIVIADYQVLTDREVFDRISECTVNLALDYMAVGLDPDSGNVFIFPHSCAPELNQLLLPFLNLVSIPELERNPTVKEEIEAAKMARMNAGMFTYPVHQAADILFCKADTIPVGKDQLPHIELTRTIARRFNARYGAMKPIFPEPQGLLSNAPTILGLDGSQKMSKSRNNSIALKATEDETAKIIKTAKTDSDRNIAYDKANRPEVANLLEIASYASGIAPEKIAQDIGSGGAGKLKAFLTESLNEFLRPLRTRRAELEKNMDYVRKSIDKGAARAREIGAQTLGEVREAMNMYICRK
ncbi:MAG: tryptophan--tRNA ligase [Alphaproteobacteria bacterium]|nr:tryptophan--tRNA ligase [Alphaproteobacteria bacterium]